MGMIDDLVAALKARVPTGDVKSDLGQQGMAGQMNGDTQNAYRDYATDEMSNGRTPVPFKQWWAQKNGLQTPVTPDQM